ncbi:type II secretion system protein GspD [Aliidiomarina shirensis]|uniref:Type II secretion system protein GspD n=1 Tax=Aliidiomarina shirensis TaxID=1048642 RepID=A0A432WUI4_9GAMM|nr:type II secretion system secretin GspD [Aliidiomarina shirensis]RUO37428.1 type II secretion system protein GspD [Aliidiomarina shirensis]
MRILSRFFGLTFALSLAWVPSTAISQEEFSASFKNTDINEFIQAVSRNLEETIIIDPEVRGRINVRSYYSMDREQYYSFFLNVLDVYGYAVIRMDNDVLKVIRSRDASSEAVPIVEDASFGGDEWVVRVIPLQNITVRELGPLLRQFNTQADGGIVATYDPSNVVMLFGRAAVLNRLAEIVQRVDRAGNVEVEVVQLEYASASEMVRIAQSVFQQQGSNTPEMRVPRLSADERTNRVLVSGQPESRERVIRLIRQLDTEMQTSGNTRVFYLKYAKAEEMVDLLRGMTDTIIAEERAAATGSNSGGAARASQGRAGNVSIEAHNATNALVVTAQPDVIRSIEGVVNQLDIRRAQVLVEAIIVEVFEGDGTDFGIQWASEDIGLMQHSNGQMVPIGQLGVAVEAARTQEGAETTRVDNAGNEFTTREPDRPGDYSLLANLLGNANGLLFGTVQDGWAAVVQAVATTTNSNILSAPSITTLDNQEANILVGQEVPTLTGATASSNNDNPFQTIDRREIGVRLRVTPQINEGDAVQLIIEQEVSSLAGSTGVDVTFNKRELSTTVLARDGETIVLGGLIDEDVQESLSKVPLLGDIPLLGHLFKSTSVSTRKRNLMIFIRPTIIRDDTTMGQLSQRKYSYMRAQQIDQRERGISLRSDDTVPVLPEWEDDADLPPEYQRFLDEWRREIEDMRREAEAGGER